MRVRTLPKNSPRASRLYGIAPIACANATASRSMSATGCSIGCGRSRAPCASPASGELPSVAASRSACKVTPIARDGSGARRSTPGAATHLRARAICLRPLRPVSDRARARGPGSARRRSRFVRHHAGLLQQPIGTLDRRGDRRRQRRHHQLAQHRTRPRAVGEVVERCHRGAGERARTQRVQVVVAPVALEHPAQPRNVARVGDAGLLARGAREVGSQDLRLEFFVIDQRQPLRVGALGRAARRVQATARPARQRVGHLRDPGRRFAPQAQRRAEQRLPLAAVERPVGGQIQLVGDRRQRVGHRVRERNGKRLAGAREQQRTRRRRVEGQVRFVHRLLLARAAGRPTRGADRPAGLVATGAMLAEPLSPNSEQVSRGSVKSAGGGGARWDFRHIRGPGGRGARERLRGLPRESGGQVAFDAGAQVRRKGHRAQAVDG